MFKQASLAILLVLSAGCQRVPADTQSNSETPQETDYTTPEDYSVVKICSNNTKVYLLQGGSYNGKYAVWDGRWEALAPGVTPNSVCD